jgi:hypothetical protein
MRDTLRKMGVSESDFIRQCDASFKQASRFDGWVTAADDDSYYHPFALPHGYGDVNLVSQWQALHANSAYADVVSQQSHLCHHGRAPKQVTTPEWAAVANYAYHLDAGKFSQFLQNFCTRELGVEHVLDHVKGIRSEDNGDIASLDTVSHGQIEADLFIDCTGFASVLLGQHYAIPFKSTRDSLFCDTALALQVPNTDEQTPIASNTISTAQKAGWIWDIGLPTRRGIGHVYSSDHSTDEEAELALRAYVTKTGGDGRAGTARKISINPGYRETFWHRNCVAVGISAGFIEPLEASALALIELSAAMISTELPATRDIMGIVAKRFNDRFHYRWERIIDFLKLHYVLSQRTDSDFWRDNRQTETISPRLLELMELWRYQPPSRSDVFQSEEIFPSASYQYVLYGMGFKPEQVPQRRSDDARLAKRFFEENALMTSKFLGGLPSNRELLDHVKKYGLQKI